MNRFVAGDGEGQEFAQVVDDTREVGRSLVKIVDCRRCRRLDDVARAAELEHAVVPTLETFVAARHAVFTRAADVSYRVDRLKISEGNRGIHKAVTSGATNALNMPNSGRVAKRRTPSE